MLYSTDDISSYIDFKSMNVPYFRASERPRFFPVLQEVDGRIDLHLRGLADVVPGLGDDICPSVHGDNIWDMVNINPGFINPGLLTRG